MSENRLKMGEKERKDREKRKPINPKMNGFAPILIATRGTEKNNIPIPTSTKNAAPSK